MYLWVMGEVNLKIYDFYFMLNINILQIYIKVKNNYILHKFNNLFISLILTSNFNNICNI
jgi:hypothetical protein